MSHYWSCGVVDTLSVPMARSLNTQHDVTIAEMIAGSRSVTDIAKSLGVSDPTVYKALHRLGLTLPTKAAVRPTTAKSPSKPVRKASAVKAPNASKAAAKKSSRSAKSVNNATDMPVPKASAAKAPLATKSATAKKSAPRKTAVAIAPVTSGTSSVELVPVAQAQDLLTVRVDKGVELLKNFSARIVKNERELTALRQRYADTLASLALT
ncbi:MAG: hypothetical protein JWL72_4478 [Ilumatobacteraceae bacterium]|nr:hypothetical protein [Ilumatobacteraceae bacterium]